MRATWGAMTWVFLVLSPLARTAPAQARSKPLGLWTGIGLGYGTARVSCSGCAASNKGGPTGTLFLGGNVSPLVRFGVETNLWLSHPDWLWNLSAALYYFPEPGSRFFVKGGAGLAQYHRKRPVVGTNGMGIGVLGGLGYFPTLGKSAVLGPVANVRYGLVGKVGTSQRTQFVADVGLQLQLKW